MRERATLIGGKLTVWSEVDAGTEVELRVACQRRLLDSQESFLVVTKACRKNEGLIREKVMNAGTSQIRILAVDDHPVVRQGIAGLVVSSRTWV